MSKPVTTQSLLVLLSLCFCIAAHAQIIPNYTFSQSNGTYSAITGGTVLASGTGIAGQRYLVTLPFTFNFDNVNYTQIRISANGWVSFDAVDPGSTYWVIPSTTTGFRSISAFDADIASLSAATELRYQTLGTSPNRTFVVQWKDFGYPSSTLLDINCQLILHESSTTSNPVDISYGSCSLGGSSSTVSVVVGLRGLDNTVYNNRSGSYYWSLTSAGTSSSANMQYQTGYNPASGLKFTYTPPSPCATPAAQPTALVLSPYYTSVGGSFTAASPAVDKYLVVRTPNVPLNTNPVNGTFYTAGTTLGNGTVVYAGNATSFTSTGLTQLTNYTYTVFSYNDIVCTGAPVYKTSTPITASCQTWGQQTYTWNPSNTSADFTVATNWTPTRLHADAGDTLVFNNGGNDTVTNAFGQTVSGCSIANNTNVTMYNAGSITIGGFFTLASGSTLVLTASSVQTFGFTSGAAKASSINGVLDLGNNFTYDGNYSATTVTGTVNDSGANASFKTTCTCVPSDIIFSAGAVYNHMRNGGVLPRAIYAPTSTVNITGITSTVPTISPEQDLGNLIWNCPNQSVDISLASAINSTLGDFTVANTNSHAIQLGSTSYPFTVGGNFTQSSGTLIISSGLGNLKVLGNMTLSSGTLNLANGNGNSNSIALYAYGNVNQSASHTIVNGSTNALGISYCGSSHQNIIAGGNAGSGPVDYLLNNATGASLTGIIYINSASNTIAAGGWSGSGSFNYAAANDSLIYQGGNAVTASSVEWPASNSPQFVMTNLTATWPANQIWLPGNRTVSGTYYMTKGVLALGPNSLSVNNLWNNADDSTNMVAADSTGQLIEHINAKSSGSAVNYNYPIGSISGGAARSCRTEFYLITNAAARDIGVRMKKMHHPNDTNTVSYLNRYWTFSDNGGSASYSYMDLDLEFLPDDVYGASTLQLNSWNGTGWKQFPSTFITYTPSVSPIDVLTVSDTLTSANYPLGGNDFTGRSVVNHIYSWTGATSMDFQDATNWNPNRLYISPSDVLQFNDGNSDTIKNMSSNQSISGLKVTNNTTVVFQSGQGYYYSALTLTGDNDPTTNELNIDSGSTMYLAATTIPLHLEFAYNSNTTNAVDGRIAGRLEIVNPVYGTYCNSINFSTGKTTVTNSGVLAAGTANYNAAFSSDSSSLIVKGTYEHKYTTAPGSLPVARWDPGSVAIIKGYTNPGGNITGGGGVLRKVIYNCPNQTSGVVMQLLVSDTLSIVSTGSGSFVTYSVTAQNYVQSGGHFDLSNGTINIGNSFTQSGGLFYSSGTGAQMNFAGTSGVQNIVFKDSAPSGPITYHISDPSGINLSGTGAFSNIFNINSGGGVWLSSPTSYPVNTALTLHYDSLNSKLTYDTLAGAAYTNITADSVVFPAVNGPASLTVRLASGNWLTLPWTRAIPVTLTMAGGDINIGANSVVIGKSAASPGTLAWTSGRIRVTTGSVTRWYGTTGLPTAAGTGIGYYPIGYNASNRNVSLYFTSATALSTGGTISLTHNNSPGVTSGLSVTDGSTTITKRENTSWSFATGNNIAASGTVGVKITTGDVFGYPVLPTILTLRTMIGSGVAGNHVAASGSLPLLVMERNGLTLANISSGAFYPAVAAGSSNVYTSVATGNWNNPLTWDQGSVPGVGAVVYIANGDTVTDTGSTDVKIVTVDPSSTLSINAGTQSNNVVPIDSTVINNGTVVIAGGALTMGPVGGGKCPFISNGTLTVSSGSMYINGSLTMNAGSTFNQSGGTISVDGNANSVTANSVTVSNIVTANASFGTVTGGKLIVVDPHVYSSYYAFTGSLNVMPGTGHITYLGDSISYTQGYTNVGFNLGTSTLGNVVINGNGTNRMVTAANVVTIAGNLTINYGSTLIHFGIAVAGNIVVNNYGYLTSYGTISFNNPTIPQTVSGAGIFRNAQVANPVANFSSLTCNNGSPYGVSFNIGDFAMSGHFYFTKGNFYLGNNTLTLTDTIPAYYLSNAGQSTGWVVGHFKQSPQPNNAFNIVYPVGDSVNFSPVTLSGPANAITKRGAIGVTIVRGDHPNIGTSNILPNKSVNKYYVIDSSAGINMTSFATTMKLYWQKSDEDLNASWPNFIVSDHKGNAWNNTQSLAISDSDIQVNLLGNNIVGSYQVGEVNTVPVIITQPQNQTICGGINATFSVGASIATTGYIWQVNTGNAWTNISNSGTYSGATTASLVVSGATSSMNGYQYRCRAYSNTDTTTTVAATLTVSASVVPTVSITSSVSSAICYGNPVVFTAASTYTGTTPTYLWKKNGVPVGSNANLYTDNTLLNNDIITCSMTSSIGCASPTMATSNADTMAVNLVTTPTVTITANPAGSICAGTPVTFTAAASNGGSAPVYQWYKNGVAVGSNSPTYTNNTLSNSDYINCILTSNMPCATVNTVYSNGINISITPTTIPSVSIVANVGTTICTGTTVTFTATPVNGGTTPVYQWKKNGTSVGTNSATYTATSIANGDVVTCSLTSSLLCSTPAITTSNGITFTVANSLVPSVSIAANTGNTICTGTAVTFTATPVNGGSAQTYQWQKNGVTVGANSATYTNNALVNGDVIKCIMTSNLSCASPTTATSQSITMNVSTTVTPSVTISANPGNAFCSGTNVTFTATATGGGASPSYQWKKNGNNAGANSATYSDNILVTGDVVTCVLTSSSSCATQPTATSSGITMTVSPAVVPSVAVTVSPVGAICTGSTVTFTATPTNGGTAPVYQWQKNGVNVGANSATYSSSSISNGDTVTCVLASNAACVSATSTTSNKIGMTVNSSSLPTVSITTSTASDTICTGTAVTFTANASNSGTGPAYQWKKNGNNVGTNSVTYTDNTLANNDVITCMLTSNGTCAGVVTSNSITMVVPPATATMTITSAQGNTICAGTLVTFTAVQTWGGSAPSYQWTKNGVNVGTNSTTYTDNGLANNDVVLCVLSSNAPCQTTTKDTSNRITITVIPPTVPTISISVSPGDSVCAGTRATFTATITNGGTTPAYKWQKNGASVGSNSASYNNNTFASGDVFRCILTSSATCLNAPRDTSAGIIMYIDPAVVPSVTITDTPTGTLCGGTPVTFTAATVNGGTSPVYQWMKNGTNTGNNASAYTDNGLINGDVISCAVTSNALCAAPATVISDSITTAITPLVTPTVSVSVVPGTTITAGTVVTYIATVANGGSAPTYQWQNNGVNIPGAVNNPYISDTVHNNDLISMVVYNNDACVLPDSAQSNALLMSVNVGVKTMANVLNILDLSPNPNKGSFAVTGTLTSSVNAFEVTVLNLLGQTVYEDAVQVTNRTVNKLIKLPADMKNGMYFLRCNIDGQIYTMKFDLLK